MLNNMPSHYTTQNGVGLFLFTINMGFTWKTFFIMKLLLWRRPTMAFYIILKSDKQIKYTLVGASPYFYSPTFQKKGRALLFPPTCTGGGG